MKIPLRPTQFETTLPEHASLEERPVFVYRAFTPEEEADWSLRGAEAAGAFESQDEDAERAVGPEQLRRLTALYCELFDRQLITITGLVVGEDDFDRERHLGHLPSSWKVQVGREILSRIRQPLTAAEEGN